MHLLTFIQAVSDDLPLENALEKMGITLKQYVEKLACKGTVVYSQSYDGSISACVIGYTHDTPDGKSYITQVATCKEYRNKGIAKDLLEEYLRFAHSCGIYCVWLTTQENNLRAQRLYEKIGFTKVSKGTNQLTGAKMVRYEYYFGE